MEGPDRGADRGRDRARNQQRGDVMAEPRHIREVMPRAIRSVARRQLAPLDADAFLAWAWRTGPRDRGTSALTVDDVWFEIANGDPTVRRETVRRDYVRLAAKVRRNQRLGHEPFEGI